MWNVPKLGPFAAMRTSTLILLALILASTGASAQLQERFLGVWRSKDQHEPVSVRINTNSIVVREAGSNTIYAVRTGTNLLFGVTLQSSGHEVEATASYKFDEMFLSIGPKQYFLKKDNSPVSTNSQPRSAAKQPFRAETNRTPSVPGSGR